MARQQEEPMDIDQTRLEDLMGRVVGDMAAAWSNTLVVLGDRLGLYRALADGPQTPSGLATRLSLAERYVREWLANQAAGGYVSADPPTGVYWLSAEQAAVLADEESPAFAIGLALGALAAHRAADRAEHAFRTGDGIGWHEHDPTLFVATERLFRPGYLANLATEWIPALDGVADRLRGGGRVADVGCGHGASTIVLAQAFPASTFTGFDYHEESTARARKAAVEAGVADRVSFEVASAQAFPGTGYDLVCLFDCLHDMGDPVGAARHIRSALGADGSVLLVEPAAGDRLADNLHPVGRLFYAASTLICVPNAVSQGGSGLGAQAGEANLRAVFEQAGYASFRRATETPFNLVFEARP